MEVNKEKFDGSKLLAELLLQARNNKNNVLYGALSGCVVEEHDKKCVFIAPTETVHRFVKEMLKEESIIAILNKFGVSNYEVQIAKNLSDGIQEDINALQDLLGDDLKIE